VQTVLVAEDEALTRLVVRRILEADQYAVIEVMDGEKALQALEHANPPVDLLLTDLSMPVLGGLEVIGAVRAHIPDLPVLVMTGSPIAAETAAALEAHGVAVIHKPVGLVTLVGAVRRALANRLRSESVMQRAGQAADWNLRLRADSATLIAAARELRHRSPPR
jgi:CheY-like chemotaxis protein